MAQPLLSGHQEYVESEPTLTDEVMRLSDRITDLEVQMQNVKRDAVVALLNMLSESMRHIAAAKMDIPDVTSGPSGDGSKWDAIKQRLPPRLREAVEILQLQGSMKRTQLASALKMDYSNCTKNVVGVLKSQGWLVENSGNLSLKQI